VEFLGRQAHIPVPAGGFEQGEIGVLIRQRLPVLQFHLNILRQAARPRAGSQPAVLEMCVEGKFRVLVCLGFPFMPL